MMCFRRAGAFVDKIFHGASPADLPVGRRRSNSRSISKTARGLRPTVPDKLLSIADEVIE
jgi:putative tryptophan/tyrosine transport system substrate-binding protein